MSACLGRLSPGSHGWGCQLKKYTRNRRLCLQREPAVDHDDLEIRREALISDLEKLAAGRTPRCSLRVRCSTNGLSSITPEQPISRCKDGLPTTHACGRGGCPCPRCKRSQTLVQLPKNFRCADLICDFCGFLAQVKAARVTDITKIPSELPGGAWGPQRARMAAGIYFPLYICLIGDKAYSIFYLSADAQQKKLFRPRTPLSASARRAGWRGFRYKLATVRNHFVRLQ